MTNLFLATLIFPLLGYLSGSLTPSIWITRLVKGVDVRDPGGILLAPALWLLRLRGIAFWVAIAVGAVIAFRFLIDWNRQYRELWLDREQAS